MAVIRIQQYVRDRKHNNVTSRYRGLDDHTHASDKTCCAEVPHARFPTPHAPYCLTPALLSTLRPLRGRLAFAVCGGFYLLRIQLQRSPISAGRLGEAITTFPLVFLMLAQTPTITSKCLPPDFTIYLAQN